MTRLTITVRYNLKELKEYYRIHFGLPQNHKVTKVDIASWLGNLAEADVETVEGRSSDYDELKIQ